MISLMLRFPNEAAMMEWVDDMKECQALPARSSVRPEDALDRNATARYALDGGQDGGREVKVSTRTVEVTEVVNKRCSLERQ
jgi:hypothetical protein